jgi:hypothetical protein
VIKTEESAVEYLHKAGVKFFRTGSREMCDPPPMDTDVDFVVLDPELIVYEDLVNNYGFKHCQQEPHNINPDYGLEDNEDFVALRCGEVNIIIVYEKLNYNSWLFATAFVKSTPTLTKECRLDKHKRVVAFKRAKQNYLRKEVDIY